MKAISHLRVRPGQKVDLESIDPDFCANMEKEAARAETAADLEALGHLQQLLYAEDRRAMLVVLQGIDTAGKDGVIRKVMTGLNPQGVTVHSFKKPTDVELSHDYLWRVHSRCPGKGEVAIFNRSHYEDIIVGRVHGFLKPKEIERRQRQINDFERMLTEEGTIVLKFFLAITKEAQLERLHARLADPAKQWKFSVNDIRERGRWDDYVGTFEDMLSNTSTDHAPWHVVPSNRKWFRNLLVSEVLRSTLDDLKLDWPKPDEDLSAIELK
jgi:PPK2 family polyphosphate:nucleotide phosphotransferase